MALVQLDAPVTPQGIPTYPVLVLTDSGGVNPDPDRYFGRPIFMWGNHDFAAPDQDWRKSMRLGRNRMARFDNDGFGIKPKMSYVMRKDHPTFSQSIRDDECVVKEGDSGGPSFATVATPGGNVLALVGVHTLGTGQDCNNDPVTGVSSLKASTFDATVFMYISDIQQAIATITGGQESMQVIYQ